MILSHRDVQTHSRLSKKKLVFKKRRLKNVSFQRLERKLKTQVTLSTLAKLSMTNLSRLHYKLKHKPHRVLPFLISDFQWAHQNFSLIWSVLKSRVFVFVLVVVKNISRDGNKFTPQKFTVTSYKYIVFKKNKNNDISNMSANRRGSHRAWLSTDSPAPQDGFFVLFF